MDPEEVLRWLIYRINHVKEYTQYVHKVHVYNNYETYFGRDYNRIYFEITHKDLALTVKPQNQLTELEALHNKILTCAYYVSNYLSFYEQDYKNEKVKIYYEWITALIRFWLSRKPEPEYELIIDYFKYKDHP